MHSRGKIVQLSGTFGAKPATKVLTNQIIFLSGIETKIMYYFPPLQIVHVPFDYLNVLRLNTIVGNSWGRHPDDEEKPHSGEGEETLAPGLPHDPPRLRVLRRGVD